MSTPICFFLEDAGGNEIQVKLPSCWTICTRCDGNGKHVNPAVDGHGISPEEFDEDPEFREAYFSGRYDVECSECDGTGKVLQIDYAHLTDTQKAQADKYDAQQSEIAADRRADAHTRMMENGGRE